MFVRDQAIRRASHMMQMDIFAKMAASEHMIEYDESSDEEEVPDLDVDHIVTIVVGKNTFMTNARSLMNFPKSTLTRSYLRQRQIGGDDLHWSCKLVFDRDPVLFYSILDAYERKTVHVPRGVCISQFKKEMEFWKLKHSLVAECCQDAYMQAFEDIYQDDVLHQRVSVFSFSTSHYGMKGPNVREQLWEFLQNSTSSRQARWYSWLYNVILVVSVVITFFETNPHFRIDILGYNGSDIVNSAKTSLTEILIHSHPHWVIQSIEITCATFFTVILVLETVSAPSVLHFCFSWRYLFDLIYLSSTWILSITRSVDEMFWTVPGRAIGFSIIQTLSISRFLRLNVLDRNYDPFKILRLSVQTSGKEIFMLIEYVAIVAFLYGGILYCAELMSSTRFGDSFMATWCAVITMTTVGYGDVVPKSWMGRFVASMCALTGITVIGMSLPLITSSFYDYFEYVFCTCEGKPQIKQKARVQKLLTQRLSRKIANAAPVIRSTPV